MYLYIYLIFLTLILYEYYIIYNIKQTQVCKKCFNNTYVDNLHKLFLILLILIMFKFLVNNLLKNNLNKQTLLFIYTLNLSIITVNLLILYYINILIIQKDIIEKEYTINCDCLVSFSTLKILNNISLLMSLFFMINLIIYIISLVYNDTDTLKYYNQILNKDLEIKEPKKPVKDDYKIVKINLPKEPKKKANNQNNVDDAAKALKAEEDEDAAKALEVALKEEEDEALKVKVDEALKAVEDEALTVKAYEELTAAEYEEIRVKAAEYKELTKKAYEALKKAKDETLTVKAYRALKSESDKANQLLKAAKAHKSLKAEIDRRAKEALKVKAQEGLKAESDKAKQSIKERIGKAKLRREQDKELLHELKGRTSDLMKTMKRVGYELKDKVDYYKLLQQQPRSLRESLRLSPSEQQALIYTEWLKTFPAGLKKVSDRDRTEWLRSINPEEFEDWLEAVPDVDLDKIIEKNNESQKKLDDIMDRHQKDSTSIIEEFKKGIDIDKRRKSI